jgi:hypothetical protein
MTTQTVEIDPMIVDIIASQRKQIHHEQGNHKPAKVGDSLNVDRVGAAGEIAVALCYDLPSPDTDLVHGDKGYDYHVSLDGETLKTDIKSSQYRNPSLMLSDENTDESAECYILCSVRFPDTVKILGWIRKESVSDVGEAQRSKFGGMMQVVDSDKLNAMPDSSKVEQVCKK